MGLMLSGFNELPQINVLANFKMHFLMNFNQIYFKIVLNTYNFF